jgi:hypothetical protein
VVYLPGSCLALCSEQAAIDSILYSYRHGFSGFAAVLTYGKVARLSGELAAFPDGHLAAVLGKPIFYFYFSPSLCFSFTLLLD